VPDEISDSARHFVQEVADLAMVRGWRDAIHLSARDSGLDEPQITLLLNRAAEYNDKADPAGRIEELADWKVEKRGRSERSSIAARLSRPTTSGRSDRASASSDS